VTLQKVKHSFGNYYGRTTRQGSDQTGCVKCEGTRTHELSSLSRLFYGK